MSKNTQKTNQAKNQWTNKKNKKNIFVRWWWYGLFLILVSSFMY